MGLPWSDKADTEFTRIADLATNIAEDVVFMVEGVVIRHKETDC
jgi:hypothetical protein